MMRLSAGLRLPKSIYMSRSGVTSAVLMSSLVSSLYAPSSSSRVGWCGGGAGLVLVSVLGFSVDVVAVSLVPDCGVALSCASVVTVGVAAVLVESEPVVGVFAAAACVSEVVVSEVVWVGIVG